MVGTSRARVPVMIVSGFLGSGKTTFVNHILTNQDGIRAAVLVNEFGAIGIDNDLIASVEERVVLLANGCICCTINDDLIPTTEQLLRRFPDVDYLLVETTGLADPLPLATTFVRTRLRDATRLDSIVTLVDAENFERLHHPVAHAQIATADILLINKTDLVSARRLELLEARLRILKRDGLVRRTEFGRLPLALVLGVALFDPDRLAEGETGAMAHGHTTVAGFESVSFEAATPLSGARFKQFLRTRMPDSVFRAKGILWFEGDDRRHVFHLSGRRVTLEAGEWQTPRSNRLVLIGTALDSPGLREALSACCVDDKPAPTP